VELHTEDLSTVEAGNLETSESSGRLLGLLREVVETLLLAGVIWAIVNFASARFVVDGSSMEPNLHSGQFLIIDRLTYRFGEPERGDIIVFEYPDLPEKDYIKRIIGLPGEEVSIHDNVVYVNGSPLDEAYIITPTSYTGTWTVGPNQYFVLGDNRNNSSDSHDWGMLDRELIVGKAWLSYWPISEWGLVEHYDHIASE
jgi:signal peptidase I